MFTRIVGILVSPLLGRYRFQRIFEKIHNFSLLGMNIGNGGDINDSGEKYAAAYIFDKLKHLDQITIFDVGANVGEYSQFIERKFLSKAVIYSFEPSRKTFQTLRNRFQGHDRITTKNFGLGQENSKMTLYSNAEASALASVYSRKLDHEGIQMNITEEVELKTLDSFCQEENINHIHFIKLDVEGHELSVFKGAVNMIASNHVDFIQFEFGGTNIDSRTFFQDFYFLLSDRYKMYRVVRDGLHPITQYKSTYELFDTTNFVAERKDLR